MEDGVRLLLVLFLLAQPADFTKPLNAVIKSLQVKQAPAVDLPDAVSCNKSAVEYRCEWKSRANKGSVTALQESIVAKVAAALPGWQRESYVRDGNRVIRFGEPAGRMAVRISAKSTEDGAPPWDYTVYLVVGDAKLVGYGNSQR